MTSVYIVGSGPCGLTCAHSLLKRGFDVTMLDYGNLPAGAARDGLNPYLTNRNRERLIAVKDMKLGPRSRESDILPSRADFVKDYFYADAQRYIVSRKTNSIINVSLAFGGLSNLWGGSSLPVVDSDISDWPIRRSDLEPHYREILDWMPWMAERDGLSRLFAIDGGTPHDYALGPQAAGFLADLESSRDALERGGVFFGRAKLAMRRKEGEEAALHPHGPIFNSGVEIRELLKHPRFRYVPDVFVREIQESASSVKIYFERRGSETVESMEGSRVFVACGSVSTTHIAMKTLKMVDREIELKTNQNVFLPFLRFRRQQGMTRMKTGNAIQLFLDFRNEDTQGKLVHVQVYEYGEYVIEPVKRIIGRLTPLFVSAARPFLERVMIFQYMLHSDLSDRVMVRLAAGADGKNKLDLQGRYNPRTSDACRDAMRSLNRQRRLIGGMAIHWLKIIDPPGGSNHLGCAFPMRATPGPAESDLLGRPGGLKRTHLTDSTVLPSLPGATMTFTAMANAARICSQVQEED